MKRSKSLAALREIDQIKTIREAQLQASRNAARQAAAEADKHRVIFTDADNTAKAHAEFTRRTIESDIGFSSAVLRNAVTATEHHRVEATEAQERLVKADEEETIARHNMTHSQSLVDLTGHLFKAGLRDLRRARDAHQDLLLESFSMSKVLNENS